jgi:hypothetical protein
MVKRVARLGMIERNMRICLDLSHGEGISSAVFERDELL